MSDPVLVTKLYVPRTRSGLINRPLLVTRLERGLNKRMTLISAPPGFGKTTLLVMWIAQQSRPAAWLSLDARDNDLSRFLTYLMAAFSSLGQARVKEDFGELAREALRTRQAKEAELILTTLINEVVDWAGSKDSPALPMLLVLDDYHVITDPLIHEAVEFLIQNLPPALHLVIASRVDPDLAMARWRVQDEISELRAADLRFTSPEISEFFYTALKIQLPVEDVEALETRTEGWIAGLQVAALSMRDRDDVSAFIQAFTGSSRYILDFLMEEVLDQLPEPVQNFLIQTSILDRLSGSLCDYVTGYSDSQELLEDMVRDNIFIVSLDDKGAWYRYHQLFREFLQSQLERRGPDLAAALHQRASAWFEENDDGPEAVEHALASGRMDRASGLIEQVSREIVKRGEWGTLQGWLSTLGDERVRLAPRLCLAQAWSLLFTASPQETEKWLDLLEQTISIEVSTLAVPGDGESSQAVMETRRLAGELLALRATLASTLGDRTKTIVVGNRALEFIPDEDIFLRSLVILSIGIAHRYKGEVADAKHALNQVLHLSQSSGNLYQRLVGLSNLANMLMLEGDYNGARETIDAALTVAKQPAGMMSPIASEIHLLDGVWLYEWNQLDQALDSIAQSIVLNEAQGIIELQYGGHVWSSRVLRAKGELQKASEQMERAEQLAGTAGLWRFQAHTAAVRAELNAFLGDNTAAQSWASKLPTQRAVRPVMLPRMEEFEDIALAHVYLAVGRPDLVHDLLRPRMAAAQLAGRIDSIYRMTAYLALADYGMGSTPSALERMAWLVSRTESQGYTRLYLDCGPKMEALLRQANAGGIEQSGTRRLLVAFENDALGGRRGITPSGQTGEEILSDREREVLILIAAGYSNRQIAEELVISIATVKRHISNIYAKLGVSSRTQALAAARERGLSAIVNG